MKSCPAGWHLPKNAEWDKLYRTADGTSGTESPYISKTAGKFLKSANGWAVDKKGTSGNGVDKFGFSAMPGGCVVRGRFDGVGNYGDWWSASELNDDAYSRSIINDSEQAYSMNFDKIKKLTSVRCIKD